MKSMRNGLVGGACLSLTLLFALAPAMAQDADMGALLDRLDRLERDIRLLNLQNARGDVPEGAVGADAVPSGPAMARVAVRLTALEEEVRALTGRAETLAHETVRLNDRLDKLVGDVDYRLNALETAMGGGGMAAAGTPVAPVGGAAGTPISKEPLPGSAPGVLGQISEKDLAALKRPEESATAGEAATSAAPQPATATASSVQAETVPAPTTTGAATEADVAAAPILPPGSAQDRYAFAFGLLRKAEYDQAEKALSEFMKAHSDSPLAHNAHYWLGETFYVRAQYARAAEVFLDAFQEAPNGNKAPDTLLKLGMSLAQLDKKQEACASFTKLERDYPHASSAIKRTVQRESQRIGCQ